MTNVFFFQVKPISDDKMKIVLDEFKSQNISFTYFEGNRNYYLFFYAKESIFIDFIYESVNIIHELNHKKRKIRSFRGFFLHVLEIMKADSTILRTNLRPFFWPKVENVIRQNKKGALEKFLFGSEDSDLKSKITSLETQIDLLHQRLIKLESKNSNFISLKEIEKEDLAAIIEAGFDLNRSEKISMRDFYETKKDYSLFQWKGYSIKYDTVRRSSLYKRLSTLN